jgi:hypothetical protein
VWFLGQQLVVVAVTTAPKPAPFDLGVPLRGQHWVSVVVGASRAEVRFPWQHLLVAVVAASSQGLEILVVRAARKYARSARSSGVVSRTTLSGSGNQSTALL